MMTTPFLSCVRGVLPATALRPTGTVCSRHHDLYLLLKSVMTALDVVQTLCLDYRWHMKIYHGREKNTSGIRI